MTEHAKRTWTHADIAKYYVANELNYRLWGPNMHYGYWDKGIWSQRRASLRFNEVAAESVAITAADRVLDAGCGVGGCSIFLAKTIGCRVTGITITPRQVELARANARRAGVEHLTEFHQMDYEHTTFADGAFSVVWGLESICYAQDKAVFLAEAHRLLGPAGRLMVADGFASRESYEGWDERLMRRWLDGWVVNYLGTPAYWEQCASKAGFASSTYRNVTAKVWPSSRLMFLASLPFLPLHIIDKFVRLNYPTDALFHQYLALRRGLWQYGIFTAKR